MASPAPRPPFPSPQVIAAMHATPATPVTLRHGSFVSTGGSVIPTRLYYTPSSAPAADPAPALAPTHPGAAPVAPAPPTLLESPSPTASPSANEFSSPRKARAAESKFIADTLAYYQAMAAHSKALQTHKEQVATYYAYQAQLAAAAKSSTPDHPLPDLILTHGRGSRLDHPPSVAFTEGFARTKCALAFEFSVTPDDLTARATHFRALLNIYSSTPAFGGRSAGARAAARAASYTSVKNLIFFTYPIIRGLEFRTEELYALSADTNVLIVSGNDDPLAIEFVLRAVRKRMRAKTWWIKMYQADHGVDYLGAAAQFPDKARRMCSVAGQMAARWLDGERDAERTETMISWDPDTARPIVEPWAKMSEDPPVDKTVVSVTLANEGMAAGGGTFSFTL